MTLSSNNQIKIIDLKNKNFLQNTAKHCKSIFLDRDGVVIKDKHYLSDASLVELEEGVYNFFKNAYDLKIRIFIITNQSGIGRGYFSWEDYEKVTKRMLELLPNPNSLCAIYASGESPNFPYKYRKPSPEFINLACKDFLIEKQKLILIGDRISDLQTAARAHLSLAALILTGKGLAEKKTLNNCMKENFFLDKDSNQKIRATTIKNLEEFNFNKYF